MDLPRCVVIQRCAAAVGYQNKEIKGTDAGGFTTILSTLPAVGADLDTLKLSEFKVTSPKGGLWGAASVNLQTFDSAGQTDGNYYYLDEIVCADYGVDPGWYDAESIDNWDPVATDNAIIPFGAGVMILCDCGASITFAGTVLDEAKTFKINGTDDGGFTVTGNCSPVDLTLADIAITPPKGGLWGAASVNVQTFDDAGQTDGNYYYLDDVVCGDYGVDPGWYDAESIDNWDPVATGNVEIAAGRMFMILCDCGASITIPSAL